MSKWLLGLVAFVVAALQAWDSHALDAELPVQAIILAGVVLPALVIVLTRDIRVRAGAVLVAAVLMVTARVVSDQPMPGLALAAFFPAMLVHFDHIRGLAAQKGISQPDRLFKQ